MPEFISKEELEKIKSFQGEERGLAIRGEAEYVLSARGKEGLQKLKERMEELDCPINYQELKPFGFYPAYYEILTTLVLDRVFNFKDEEFRKLGRFEAKLPFMIRGFLKFFGSIEMVAARASDLWKNFFTFGKLTVEKFSKEERFAVMIIENFYHYPKYCRTLEGFIASMMELIVKNEVACRKIECPHQGGNHHKFKIEW
ncbi:MAG: hypothetical protein GF370_02245 [Candidatus Nealsonbacteria bacterium]|nr:hypothetical protein [Candidatus Nealsonbacteria bacterium]